MNHTILKTPGGEELVVMSRADFEAMRDALDAAGHATTLADVASGRQEALTAGEVEAALAEPTPLAFWRKRRGLTQAALAQAAGISQSYVAGLESGARKGDPALFLRLARALRVRMEDLIVE
jgi:DNA-binding XRE family transcriptional regulator